MEIDRDSGLASSALTVWRRRTLHPNHIQRQETNAAVIGGGDVHIRRTSKHQCGSVTHGHIRGLEKKETNVLTPLHAHLSGGSATLAPIFEFHSCNHMKMYAHSKRD